MTQRTYSGVLGDSRCECSDSGCFHHKGKSSCHDLAVSILYRIDTEDITGTAFCEMCANDAFESGLFTDSTEEDEIDNHGQSPCFVPVASQRNI